MSATSLGHDLYTGKRSFAFVPAFKLWFSIAAALILLSVLFMLFKGFALGIELTGGSEFQIQLGRTPLATSTLQHTPLPHATSPNTSLPHTAPTKQSSTVHPTPTSGAVSPAEVDLTPATAQVLKYTSVPPRVQKLGNSIIRIQTEPLPQESVNKLRDDLASLYSVPQNAVSVTIIGPSWGADITRQMIIGIIVFLVLVSIFMAFYFRTWKMSLAAIIALIHDLLVTGGVYSIIGFEVTPAAIIGFLTIMGYSLYDTVVVFDKIKENTALHNPSSKQTFAELVNLAINQTLVRSINTSVVALLPVSSILFIGALFLGAGTLRDIALALFVGMIVGVLSTLFIAGPLYVLLRKSEKPLRDTDSAILLSRKQGIVEQSNQHFAEQSDGSAEQSKQPLAELSKEEDEGSDRSSPASAPQPPSTA